MIKTLEDFTEASKLYLEKINTFADKHSISENVKADHVGYKCASTESFENLKSIFEINSDYIFQSIISSRRIAYIKIKQGLETKLGIINFIELQDQKPDGSQIEKFDHVECFTINGTYDEMVKKIAESDTITKSSNQHHPTHDTDLGGGFSFKLTQGPLLTKIKDTEMV